MVLPYPNESSQVSKSFPSVVYLKVLDYLSNLFRAHRI